MDLKASQWRPGQNVCRCCLTEGCYKDISSEYFWMGKREVYTEMLSDCFGVTICQTPPISSTSVSRLICDDCVSRLRDASNFKRQVLDCEKMFKQYLEPAVDETGIEFSADLLKVKRESVKTEIDEADDSLDQNVEYLEDDAFDDLDDEPLTKLASKTKKESVDIMDLLDNEKFSKAPEPKAAIKRKSTIIVKATPPKKSKPQKVVKAAEPTTSSSIKDDKKKGPVLASRIADKIKSEWKWTIKPTERLSQTSLNMTTSQLIEFRRKLLIAKLNRLKQLKPTISRDLYVHKLNSLKSNSAKQTVIPKFTPGQILGAKPMRVVPKSMSVSTINRFTTRHKAEIIIKCSNALPFRTHINKINCVLCYEEFYDPVALRQHVDTEHKRFDMKTVFHNVKNYIRIDITNLKCKLCSKSIDDIDSLINHLRQVHKENINGTYKDSGVLPFKLVKNDWRCILCNSKFNNFFQLNNHILTHYQNYICATCGFGFITEKVLQAHVKTHTNNFPCPKCDTKLLTSYELEKHLRQVHNNKRHRCMRCNIRFAEYRERQRHMIQVHGEEKKSYKCMVCDQIFDSNQRKLYHMKRSHSEANVPCLICPAAFHSKTDLKDHMIKHSVEHPYKCSVCNKAYARKKTLTEHMRIHNNDRRFSCPVCERTFVQKCSMKSHMKTNHPGKSDEITS